MASERCECCDLLIESCGKTIEQQERAKNITWARASTLPAKFPGICIDCDNYIRVGDSIRYDLTLQGWTGECCNG